MTDPTVFNAGEGEQHDIGAGSMVVIKAAGTDTGESFFLSETTLASGFAGPPPHRHERLHDMFYVLEGSLTIRLGDRTYLLDAGGFVCVPPGVVHSFSNPGGSPVRFLNFNTPAGWEHYMRELGHAAKNGPLTSDAIGRIASRHDFHLAN